LAVAVKSAEDAQFYGVHLSEAQREAMDRLVECVLERWQGQGAEAAPRDGRDTNAAFEALCQLNPGIQALRAALHLDRAAKRRAFFLQYLQDALEVWGAGPGRT